MVTISANTQRASKVPATDSTVPVTLLSLHLAGLFQSYLG